jgi:hypothetical protein
MQLKTVGLAILDLRDAYALGQGRPLDNVLAPLKLNLSAMAPPAALGLVVKADLGAKAVLDNQLDNRVSLSKFDATQVNHHGN